MEQFTQLFLQKGFSVTQLNATDISLFLRKEQEVLYAILLFDMSTGKTWDSFQCTHIEEQLSMKLHRVYDQPIEFYTFLITYQPDCVKDIYQRNNHTGVIDLSQNRLLIFENMREDRFHLYSDIDRILQEVTSDREIPIPQGERKEFVSGISQFGIINIIIIVINVLVFGLTKLFHCYDEAIESGSLSWYFVHFHHQYYRIFTSIFLHGGISHLFNNMVILAYVGGILENKIGKLRYVILYLMSGILAGIVSMRYNMEKVELVQSIGASGAIFGVVGAVLLILLLNKGRIENLSRRQMILFVFFSLYGGFAGQNVDNAAHVGGLLAGFILGLVIYRKPKRRNVWT